MHTLSMHSVIQSTLSQYQANRDDIVLHITTISMLLLKYSVRSHDAGEVDFHFFIKYQWPASAANDIAYTAFAQDRIKLMAPYVTSTQVSNAGDSAVLL